uniref:Uncharacterized protein n=1 Tax=Populus trichocarpa TaxID=3694 RepID=A0A2K1WRQ0_POPTR
MGDHEGPWSRSVTFIALRRGAGLRSPQEGEPTSKFVAEGAARVAAPTQYQSKSLVEYGLDIQFSDRKFNSRT